MPNVVLDFSLACVECDVVMRHCDVVVGYCCLSSLSGMVVCSCRDVSVMQNKEVTSKKQQPCLLLVSFHAAVVFRAATTHCRCVCVCYRMVCLVVHFIYRMRNPVVLVQLYGFCIHGSMPMH